MLSFEKKNIHCLWNYKYPYGCFYYQGELHIPFPRSMFKIFDTRCCFIKSKHATVYEPFMSISDFLDTLVPVYLGRNTSRFTIHNKHVNNVLLDGENDTVCPGFITHSWIFLHFQIVVAFFRKTQNSPKFISIPLRNSLRSNARKPIFFRLARWKIFLQGCTVYTKYVASKLIKSQFFRIINIWIWIIFVIFIPFCQTETIL